MKRPDPGQLLLEDRIMASSSASRVDHVRRSRRIGLLKVWQQADAAGPMSELARAEFLLRRLYPTFPEVQLRQVLDQLAAAEAAGTWHGFRRPEPLEEQIGGR